jgi:hypothetical protein
VVGLRRIARRRTDALILFEDHLVGRKILIWCIAPEFLAHALVHPFREGFGQTIRQRFHENGRVIVVRILEAIGDDVFANASGDHEHADIVLHAGRDRRDEVGQRGVETALTLLQLLAQGVQRGHRLGACFVAVENDVVAFSIRRPEPDGRAGCKPFSSTIRASIFCASS